MSASSENDPVLSALQEELNEHFKRKNQLFFSTKSLFLLPINQTLSLQDRRTVTLWALTLAEETAGLLSERYLNDISARNAVALSSMWAHGTIKMAQARPAILTCHAAAKIARSAEDAALFHAVGQACSVVHSPKHLLGYPVYELTAIVYRFGINSCEEALLKRREEYLTLLSVCKEKAHDPSEKWAGFLLK